MLIKDLKKAERAYYAEKRKMVVPDLMCSYFEQKEYELTYYFADKYRELFEQAEFYFMMSLMMLDYPVQAEAVHRKHKEDWFNLCKQGNVYWKHVALFALLFGEYELSTYYEALFEEYYEDTYIQLLSLLKEEELHEVVNSSCYRRAVEMNPVIGKVLKQKRRALPEVMTFEHVEWNVWKRYNQSIKNGGRYGIEKVYDREGLRIYSYKPKEVAASMHILTDEETSLILDCGCEMVDTEVVRIPVKEILEELGIEKVDGVFISHAHMDHYGSLNEIRHEQIYMTSTTKQLIRLASPETALSMVRVLEGYSGVNIGEVNIYFIPNGHIRGSVAMDIDWKGRLRVIYTGDYAADPQKTVAGLNTEDIRLRREEKIDVLITETTYGKKKGMLSLKEYEKMFVLLCQKMLENGNKLIIPCFSIGRVQEIALLLLPLAKLGGKKILIDGAAARITEFYQLDMDENILNKNISIGSSEIDYSEKLMNNDIILASSGMIKPGSTSERYVLEMIEKQDVAIVKVGFIHQHEHILLSIINRQDKNLNYIDVPLSAHAGHAGLVRTLESLSPDCAIYVHGGGIEK